MTKLMSLKKSKLKNSNLFNF